MALDSPEDGGAAGTIVSTAPLGLPPEGRQPAAIGPWRLAADGCGATRWRWSSSACSS